MTGALDTRMRATASRLINKFGATMTLRRQAGVYDPATGKNTETATDYAIVGSPPSPVDLRRVDGEMIKQGDAETILAASDLTVAPDQTTDHIVFAGETWSVVAVEPIYSGEQVAAYQLRLRK